MFDFRYHALSLVAVFIALAVGLLLGVAIGDRGLVSSAEKDLRASLRRNVERANEDRDAARRTLTDRQRDRAGGLLPGDGGRPALGERIGIVALGDVSDAEVRATKQALEGTGASSPRSPSWASRSTSARSPTPRPRPATPSSRRTRPWPGASAGRSGQLALGGKFLSQIRGALLQRRSSGTLDGLEGVVLIRHPPRLEGQPARAAQLFENGLIKGLTTARVRVVGAERSEQQPSSVPWFQDHGLSSVDGIDLVEGRVALVLALTGEQGTFGTKSTANALLPSIVSTPAK